MNTIINIGRTFGSGGGSIGKVIGSRLDIPVYDHNLISEVAVEKGYSKSLFSRKEEKKGFFSLEGGYSNDNMMFSIQSEIIRSVAEQGDAIIIGRCADYILRDLRCLDVFVTAPIEYRVKRLKNIENLTAEEAEKLMQKKDRLRENYYKYFTFGRWGDAANYDLCVDSSLLGIEGTADFIIDFGRKAGLILR